jgi:hypothetical protein
MAFKSPLRGIQAARRRQDLLYGGGAATYADKVLGYSPIAYWPLWEASGTAAVCQVNSAQNGTYSSDVAGWPPGTGIGDGNTAPFFDGTNDYVNIWSTVFRDAFDGNAGTLMVWGRVANVGVWTDGALRMSMILQADGNNFIQPSKNSTNNQFRFRNSFGGAFAAQLHNTTNTGFVCYHESWSWGGANTQIECYAAGANVGTLNPVGQWAGNLANTSTVIGAGSTTPTLQWHGWIGHVAVWDAILDITAIQDLATV